MKKLTATQKKILHVISMDTDVQKLWNFINDGLENKDIIIWKLAFHLARKDLLKIYGGVLFDKAEQELRFAIGYDNAKHNFEFSNIEEVSDGYVSS